MKQVRNFNARNAGTKAGWCLRNVRMGYGIAPLYNSAWDNWNATPQKRNRTIPTGVDVPLFYDYTDRAGNRYGHINVRLKDGRIWNDGKYYSSLSTFERAWGNVKYVGWSTHVNNVQVIKENPVEVMDTNAKVQSMYRLLRGRNATTAEVAGWRGKTYQAFAESPHTATEVTNRTNRLTSLEKQVSDLTKRITALEKTNKEQAEALTKANKQHETTLKTLEQKTEELTIQIEANAALKEEAEALDDDMQDLQAEVSDLDKENTKLINRNYDLELELGTKGELSGTQHITLGFKKLIKKLIERIKQW